MSYAATTIIMYGISIDEKIAEKIKNNEIDEDNEFNDKSMYDNVYYRKDHRNSRKPQQLPITPYKYHCDGMSSQVFYPEMLSDETDSRIHCNTFESGHQHYLGIYIASKGYAYTDDVNKFIKCTPKEAIENFNNSIKPLLDKYGIKDEPEIKIINQIW